MLKDAKKKLDFFFNSNKRLWKFFVFLFLINFIIINWNDIAWLFNYKFIYEGLASIIRNDEEVVAKDAPETLAILDDLKKSEGLNGNIVTITRESKIEIPRIDIEAPIIFPEYTTLEAFQKALKKGVIHYPQSALPGEKGIVIILGHSAAPTWPKINYDWVFTRLNELENGDDIHIHFQGQMYLYKVSEKVFFEKGQEITASGLTTSDSMIYLITCWPPGRDNKRIVVKAVLSF